MGPFPQSSSRAGLVDQRYSNDVRGFWESRSYMFFQDFSFITWVLEAKIVQRTLKRRCGQSFPQVLRPVSLSWCAFTGVRLAWSLFLFPWT